MSDVVTTDRVITLGEFSRHTTPRGTDLGRESAKVFVGAAVIGSVHRVDGRGWFSAYSCAGYSWSPVKHESVLDAMAAIVDSTT